MSPADVTHSSEHVEERRGDDRRKGERRRYNRRQTENPASPPYFETFDRIAKALEEIAEAVSGRTLVLPTQHDRPPEEQR